ncbi:MAG: hypothetical protein J6T16_00335, partial [Opitutales bacterium]|nr:hypothetical protein [Opitutales bacterium]
MRFLFCIAIFIFSFQSACAWYAWDIVNALFYDFSYDPVHYEVSLGVYEMPRHEQRNIVGILNGSKKRQELGFQKIDNSSLIFNRTAQAIVAKNPEYRGGIIYHGETEISLSFSADWKERFLKYLKSKIPLREAANEKSYKIYIEGKPYYYDKDIDINGLVFILILRDNTSFSSVALKKKENSFEWAGECECVFDPQTKEWTKRSWGETITEK